MLAAGCADDETALDADGGGDTSEATSGGGSGPGSEPATTTEPAGTTTGEPGGTDTGSGSDDGGGTAGGSDESDTGEPPSGSGLCLGASFEGVNARVWRAADGRPFEGTCEVSASGCGGDPLGTWEVESWCGDPAVNPYAAECPSSTFEIEVVDVSGTRTFEADNAFSESITTVTNSTLVIDPACLGLSCGELQTQLTEDFPTIDCASGGGMCTCELSATRTSNVQGTWELAGGVLGLTADNGGVQTFSICVTDGAMETWEDVYAAVPTDMPCDTTQQCIDELGDMYDGYVCVDGAGE